MRNEDIEILDDFQENQAPNSNNIPDMNKPLEPQAGPNTFDQMISDNSVSNMNNSQNNNYNQGMTYNQNNNSSQGMTYSQNNNASQSMAYNQNNNFNQGMAYNQNMNQPIQNSSNQYNSYPNDYNNNFSTDVNNNMIQPNAEQDLTITAVYPNGLAIEENEELENTRVIKPKKKSGLDLYLIIIVAVLAITLVVLLVVFYF